MTATRFDQRPALAFPTATYLNRESSIVLPTCNESDPRPLIQGQLPACRGLRRVICSLSSNAEHSQSPGLHRRVISDRSSPHALISSFAVSLDPFVRCPSQLLQFCLFCSFRTATPTRTALFGCNSFAELFSQTPSLPLTPLHVLHHGHRQQNISRHAQFFNPYVHGFAL